ncbi:MAG: hypothetical protein OXI88_17155 [Gammaproteobacteria bacterium]|nr:hypothetical protein [Gammaproteobacteria bacterium]MDE0513500.1 hypothetical protein [Gammaproteobacteria bacterium]
MSSSDIGGFSVSDLARFRADATLSVDSATGQLRVTDRKNPFQRAITWVRDALRLRSKDAVELEKNETRAAYNRFFASVADELGYREQLPALQETLAANIIGNNPKPLSVRTVRKIMGGLEQPAAPDAGPGHLPASSASSDASAATQQKGDVPAATVAARPPAANREHPAPETPAREPDSLRARMASLEAEDAVGVGEPALRRWSMPAGRIVHGDEADQLEWDHETKSIDPGKHLEEEFDEIIAGFEREFPRGGKAGNEVPGAPATDETAPDDMPEPDADAALAEATDAGPEMDPYQTVFIDDLDEMEAAEPEHGEGAVEAIVQQRLQAIAERMRDEQIAEADVKVIKVMADSGPEDYDDKVAEAREQRDQLAATLEKQLHTGHIDVVNAGIEEVCAEVEQLENEAMATDRDSGEWQRLRGRFLRLEQELNELERLQQA